MQRQYAHQAVRILRRSGGGAIPDFINGSGMGLPKVGATGTTPAQQGIDISFGSSIGGPLRTLAAPSSIAIHKIAVAFSSWLSVAGHPANGPRRTPVEQAFHRRHLFARAFEFVGRVEEHHRAVIYRMMEGRTRHYQTVKQAPPPAAWVRRARLAAEPCQKTFSAMRSCRAGATSNALSMT
jgi:hypothetical protein